MNGARSIGFVGTGIMGFQMARRLAEAGHSIAAWNRTPDKAERLEPFGVSVVGQACDAGRDADLVIVMVADGPTSDRVLIGDGAPGLLDTMGAGATLVVMSSIPMETAQAQATAATERGLGYLDAPVSGGEPGARDGTLAIMAGGDRSVFDALGDVFAVLGRATLVGPAGAGSLVKLANQVIVGNTISTVAEALTLAAQGGADPKAVIEALKGGFADSPILQNHGRRMIEGDFNPGAPSRIQLKDMRSAKALADKLSLTLPMTQQALALYVSLAENGHEELDHAASYLEIQRLCGLDRSSGK